MKLILTKDIQNLGEVGDLVTVKDGYARNYLLPRCLAEVATKGALENREKNLERVKAKLEKLHKEALENAEQIEKIERLELSARAGDSGKLFGTITTKKLAEELNSRLEFEVDRKNIILDKPINKIGEYLMTIKLTSKVKCSLNVIVSASEVIQEEFSEEAL